MAKTKSRNIAGISSQHGAIAKSQAVLSIWTEKRKPREICRELGVHWAVLRRWENQALDGMIKALSSGQKEKAIPPLAKRMERMLDRKAKKLPEVVKTRLEKRLETVTKPKEVNLPAVEKKTEA